MKTSCQEIHDDDDDDDDDGVDFLLKVTEKDDNQGDADRQPIEAE